MTYVNDGLIFQEQNEDPGTIFQDRYWPSVVSYGRFFNQENSLHNQNDYTSLFIEPDKVVRFNCSTSERIRRHEERDDGSNIDNYLFSKPERIEQLDEEIDQVMEDLPTYSVDTTDKSIEECASEVEDYLQDEGILQRGPFEAQ